MSIRALTSLPMKMRSNSASARLEAAAREMAGARSSRAAAPSVTLTAIHLFIQQPFQEKSYLRKPLNLIPRNTAPILLNISTTPLHTSGLPLRPDSDRLDLSFFPRLVLDGPRHGPWPTSQTPPAE